MRGRATYDVEALQLYRPLQQNNHSIPYLHRIACHLLQLLSTDQLNRALRYCLVICRMHVWSCSWQRLVVMLVKKTYRYIVVLQTKRFHFGHIRRCEQKNGLLITPRVSLLTLVSSFTQAAPSYPRPPSKPCAPTSCSGKPPINVSPPELPNGNGFCWSNPVRNRFANGVLD